MNEIQKILETLIEDLDKIEIAIYQNIVDMYDMASCYEDTGGYLPTDIPGIDEYHQCSNEEDEYYAKLTRVIGGYPHTSTNLLTPFH